MSGPPGGVSERAWRVYHEAIVVDLHNDMPERVASGYDPDVRHRAGFAGDDGQTDLPRLVESGVAGQVLVAWVDAPYARATPDGSFARAMQLADIVRAFAERHPGQLAFATTAAEIRAARRGGRVAVLLAVEGGHAIEGSLEKLRALHARGARYLTLTWNNGNAWAGSSIGSDGTRTGGLTEFGRGVIAEMNRLGMLVDLSHVSDATFDDAIRASGAPVIASHSNARALADHPRNLTDAQLRAIAGTGGVIGVNFYPRFLSRDYDRAREAVDADIAALRRRLLADRNADPAAVERRLREDEQRLAARIPTVPLSVVLDHLDHVARVAGTDHVALGSDFDGVSALPEGLEDVTRLPRIADGLLTRGWSERDVTKLLGGNALRLLE